MGIVNVTPDSFSDGGNFFSAETAIQHAMQLVDEGAAILDVGGESTRPGSQPVSLEEELRRVVPVIRELSRKTEVPISVDTTKAEVARQALEAGASLVNDISGLRFDSQMLAVCRDFQAGIVCNHVRGTPQTMQANPEYENDDVVAAVMAFFQERVETFLAAGISKEQIVLDPGIGFGKTPDHNLKLLAAIPKFRELGFPILIGHSRKRFLQKVLGRSVDERLFGTVGVSVAAAALGADILRVHDVAANRDALLAWQAVMNFTR